MKETPNGVSVKMHNKVTALGELAKSLGMYDHKVDVTQNISIMISEREFNF